MGSFMAGRDDPGESLCARGADSGTAMSDDPDKDIVFTAYGPDLDLHVKPPNRMAIYVGGKVLLTLRRNNDGLLTAEYDPADLDAAAQTFVTEVTRLLGEQQ